MAARPRRSWLDGWLARALAFLIFVGCVALIVVIERGRWQLDAPPVAAATGDAVAGCLEQRHAEIDQLVDEGLIGPEQAGLFRERVEAVCHAQLESQRRRTGGDVPVRLR